MGLFQVLLWAAALVGIAWILRLIFVDGRRRQVPTTLLVVAGTDAVCGLASLLLGSGHLFGVIGRALKGWGSRGAPAFSYDFRFYSLVMLGLLVAIPGLFCLRYARGLTTADRSTWKGALWSSIMLVVVNAPLIPLQGFAILLGGLALLNFVALAATRKWFVETV